MNYRVTIFYMLVLSLTAYYIVRLANALFFWNTLNEFDAQPGALYLALTGLFWTLAFVGLLAFHAKNEPYGNRRITLTMLGAYIAFFWFERLYLQQGDLFAGLGISLFILIFAALFAPGTPPTESESYERK